MSRIPFLSSKMSANICEAIQMRRCASLPFLSLPSMRKPDYSVGLTFINAPMVHCKYVSLAASCLLHGGQAQINRQAFFCSGHLMILPLSTSPAASGDVPEDALTDSLLHATLGRLKSNASGSGTSTAPWLGQMGLLCQIQGRRLAPFSRYLELLWPYSIRSS